MPGLYVMLVQIDNERSGMIRVPFGVPVARKKHGGDGTRWDRALLSALNPYVHPPAHRDTTLATLALTNDRYRSI